MHRPCIFLRNYSEFELDKLHEVSERNKALDEWDMAELSHRELPEWQKNDPARQPKKPSKPISLADILEAIGRLKDKDAIIRQAEEDEAASKVFPE